MRMRVLASVVSAALIVVVNTGFQPGTFHDVKPRYISLLIGISDYQHFSARGPAGQTDLQGPLNDVERMRASLRRWGFGDPGSTKVLVNESASRTGVLQALDWLATATTDSTDVVVVYYSGHGSYATDADGDERRLATNDTLDEGLVPWDAQNIHDGAQLILDDEIRERLGRLKTRNVTVLLDACYSGTATRAPGQSETRRAKGPVGPATSGAASARGTSLDLLQQPGHTLITAASAQQLADEQLFREDQKIFGVFTYYLTRVLDAARPSARYDEVMQEVRLAMSNAFLPQTPQLEGDQSAPLFNVSAVAARRPFAVVQRKGPQLTIDFGAVHGVREQSVFDVFAPNDASFSDAPLAQLRVDSVTHATAYVSVLGEAAAVVENARAVLARVPRGAKTVSRLPVLVQGPARADLGKLGFIRVVDDSSIAETRVKGDHVSVRGITLPPLPDRSSVCDRLARAYAIASFELIQNPQPPSDIDVQVRVVPTGKDPEQRSTPIDTAYIGQFYDFYARVDAPANTRLFLSAGVVGYSSPPFMLYPQVGVAPPLFPLNRWVKFFTTDIVKPAGVELIKVIVSSDPFDFDALIKSLPNCDGARSGESTRWNAGSAAVTGWTTVEHRLLIEVPR
jgi:hypothetical protein